MSLLRASALPLDGLDEREGLHLAVNFEGQLAAPDHRGGHADIASCPVGQPHMNMLQIRLERAAAEAGGFLANAAQVLGLAALGLVIAERGLLTADFTFTTHRNRLLATALSASDRFPGGAMPASSCNRKLLLGLLFGERVMRLAALHVTAFFHQFTDLVRRNGELALRANIQGRSDQKIVTPSLPFC